MPVALPLALVGLVIFQGLLGMWTVTLLLKPLIVTAHLAFGLTTLSMLWWLWMSLRRPRANGRHGRASAQRCHHRVAPARAPGLRRLCTIALVALIIQILLGGWTSTNYAAVACPDFPRCQASWWPTADFRDAFVVWRGLGINYEGGVLDSASRVAIHFTHRLGAMVATLSLLLAAILTLRLRREPASRRAAWAVLAALALQLCIGISMVLRGFPLPIATAHNAGAALLLLATLALYRALAPGLRPCRSGLPHSTWIWSRSGMPLATMMRRSTNWREARSAGDVECTAWLGLRLLTGDRAPLLPSEGWRFLSEACEQGSGFAAARGAAIMALGVQVPQNWKLALEWLAKAAQKDHVPAQRQLLALSADRELAARVAASSRPDRPGAVACDSQRAWM